MYLLAEATARFSLNHEEKRSKINMSNGRSSVFTWTAWTVIFLTSGSFSSKVDELLVFSGSSVRHKKSGPFIQVGEFNNSLGVTDLEAMSAGLFLPLTWCHESEAVLLLIACTLFPT